MLKGSLDRIWFRLFSRLFSFQESIRLEVLTLIHFSFARSFSFINSFPFLCWTRMKECGICLTRWNFLDSLRTARSSGSHLFHSLFFPFSRARSRKGKRETAYETTIGIPSCPLRESEAGMKRKMEPMKRLLITAATFLSLGGCFKRVEKEKRASLGITRKK